ncbi:MAG: DUF4381 domain-containing protein [Gammaproteobacteria bacterium]|nr:MAG: DUF4381 domain-containing protein [Gammaproteobacteria bacterium]
MNEQTLNLRDIHLPEPISWWPLAPGWWILVACIIFVILTLFIARKIYQARQLKRDITAELEQIKQQFKKTQNKSQLARSLSVLLRRANITYNPTSNIAGLTGDDWLTWLDDTNKSSTADTRFQSDTGKILLSAPYLPENAALDFNARELIHLCESWLQTSHGKQARSS